jgi:hypothetical protein
MSWEEERVSETRKAFAVFISHFLEAVCLTYSVMMLFIIVEMATPLSPLFFVISTKSDTSPALMK